jgi:DNA-directed RNA polymerase subunit RPC12/RpoP
MSDKLSVTFKCKACGGTVLELPDHPTDDSRAVCKGCGIDLARWGDIKAKSLQVARDEVRRQFKGVFKGLQNWSVK